MLLTVFYYTLMAPFGIWQGLIADRLALRRRDREGFWISRSTAIATLDQARKQS